MERQKAEAIFLTASDEARKNLHAASRCKDMPVHRNDLMERARNVVFRSLALFEAQDGTEEHEDLYVPLVDCLALVNDGLKHREFVYERIAEAMSVLDCVPSKGGAM